MDAQEQVAYWRAKAQECSTTADALTDPREAKLHRAFADQFQRHAETFEAETRT
jgi:hypothetical protein